MQYITYGENIILFKEKVYFLQDGIPKIYDVNKNFIFESSQKEYLEVKFGVNYAKFQNYFDTELIQCTGNKNSIDECAICFYQESVIRFFAENGDLIWELQNKNFSDIYDICINDQFLWVTYPVENIILKYSLKDKVYITEYSENLNYPESLSLYNDNIYVSNMGNKNVLQIRDNKLYQQKEFTEPVWEYVENNYIKVVRLSSGLYLL